jgi:repressor LexA
MPLKWTEKQGQYLAFICNYTKIHGRSPAETEMESYFKVTPPTVHQMILKLEENELICRVPGQARSIRLLVHNNEIPPLK